MIATSVPRCMTRGLISRCLPQTITFTQSFHTSLLALPLLDQSVGLGAGISHKIIDKPNHLFTQNCWYCEAVYQYLKFCYVYAHEKQFNVLHNTDICHWWINERILWHDMTWKCPSVLPPRSVGTFHHECIRDIILMMHGRNLKYILHSYLLISQP